MPGTFRLLQDVLQARRKSTFIGRDEALHLFNQNLDYAAEDERKRFVIHVSGPSGSGITRLMQRFREIAHNRGHRTAWAYGQPTFHPIDLMETWVQQLGRGEGRFPTFLRLARVYRRLERLLRSDAAFPLGATPRFEEMLLEQWLPKARAGTLSTLLDRLVEYGKPLLAPQTRQALLARKLPTGKERALMMQPLAHLTRAFLNDLLEVAESTPVVLFLDDYHLVVEVIEPWLLQVFEGVYGPVSLNVLWVLGGNEPLDQVRWGPYESILARLALEPFTEHEVRDLLVRRGVQSAQAGKVLMYLSKGKPVWVAALAHALPEEESDLGALAGEPLPRLMQWLPPQQREYLMMAALPQVVTPQVLAVLLGEQAAQQAWAWLREQPFFHTDGERGFLNREIHQALLRYWRSRHFTRFVTYNERLIQHFAQARQGEPSATTLKDPVWQTLYQQEVYHHLLLARDDALARALDGFFTALDADWDWAYRWARMMKDLGALTESWSLHKWGSQLLELYLALNQGEVKKAAGILQTVVNAPEPVSLNTRALALTYRGLLLFLQEEYEQALQDLNTAVRMAPHRTWIRERRAVAYLMAREPAQALKDLLMLSEGAQRPWVTFARGCTYVLLEQFPQALADFNQAAQDPEMGPWALAMRGEVYRLQGQHVQALEDYKAAWQRLGFRPWLAHRLGTTLLRLGRFPEAAKVFDEMLKRDPNDAWAWANRGLAYEMMGYFSRALADFSEALRRKPDFVWVLARRGELFMLLGRQDQALRDFNQALSLKPPYGWVRALRALLLTRKGKTDAALKDVQRALQQEPNNPWYHYTLGLVLYRMGRTQEAQNALRQAITLAEKHSGQGVLEDLNRMLYALAAGDFKTAETLWQQVLPRKPSPFFLRMVQYHLDLLETLRPEMRDVLRGFARRVSQALTQGEAASKGEQTSQ